MNVQELIRLPLFTGLDTDAAAQLLAESPHAMRTYRNGEFIARQDDICKSLYVLCNGEVRTMMENAEGKQLTIDRIRAPEILAPAFIYASQNRFPVSVEAIGTCEVWMMDKLKFLECMHRHPAVMRTFIEMISDRSLFLSRKLNEFALQSLKSRLLNYIKINKAITNQQEAAFILGVARPSLARALSELSAEGRIRIDGKSITVI